MKKVGPEPSFSDIKMEKFINDFPKSVPNEVVHSVPESQDENHDETIQTSQFLQTADANNFAISPQNEVIPSISEPQVETHTVTMRLSQLFKATEVVDSSPKEIDSSSKEKPKSEFKFLKPSKYALRQKNVYTKTELPNDDKPATPTTLLTPKSIIHKPDENSRFTPKKKVKFDASCNPEKPTLVENKFVVKRESNILCKIMKGIKK